MYLDINQDNRISKIILFILSATTIIGSVSITCMGIVYNYVNSKVVTIQIGCLALIILGIVILSWNQIKLLVTSSRSVQAVLLFSFISLLATANSLDPALSFYGHLERGTGLFLLLLSVGGSLMALGMAFYNNSIRSVILYPIALAGGILGFLTWIGATGMNNASWIVLGASSGGGATMGNSSFAGTVLILSFFITIYLITTTKNQILRMLLIGIGFFTLINPVLFSVMPFFHPLAGKVFGSIGDARGAALALIGGFGMFLGILMAFSDQVWIKISGWVLSVTVGFVSILGIMMLLLPGTIVHNFFLKESGGSRFIYWHMASQQIAQYPLLGTGPETFRYAHEKYFDPRLLTVGEPWADKPHSVYVETVLGTGYIGLIAYVAIFASMIWRIVRMRKDSKNKFFIASSLGLLMAYALNNIILFDTMTSTFLFFMVVFWIAGYTEWEQIHLEPVPKKISVGKVVSIKMLLVLAIMIPTIWILQGEIKKLRLGRDELFAQPPNRSVMYQAGESASPYGAGISFAQRADGYGQSYMNSSRESGSMVLDDIRSLVSTLRFDMAHYPPNTQSYIALGNLAIAHVRQSGTYSTEWVDMIHEAGEGVALLSPNNPKSEYFLNLAKEYKKAIRP